MTESADLDLRVRRALRSEEPRADLDALVMGAMGRVATTRQRPAMQVADWWTAERAAIPMAPGRRRSWILLVAIVVLSTLVVATALIASRPPLPEPFGLARTGLLAFGVGGDIHLVDVATGTTEVVSSSGGGAWGPTWSRDGRLLAYWRSDTTPEDLTGVCGYATGGATGRCGFDAKMFSLPDVGFVEQRRSDLLVYDPVTDTTDTLATGVSPTGVIDWSPDGTRVAFSALVEGTSRILVAHLEQPGLTEVGPADLRGMAPAWSPDGTSIAFKGGVYDGERGVFVMRADGTDARRITTVDGVGGLVTFHPAWSPDGRRIAFAAGYGGDFATWLVDADGTDERRLAERAYSPRWSPDGARLAVVTTRDQVPGATVVVLDPDDPDASHRIEVKGIVDHSPPDWSPDGRWLFGSAAPDTAAHEDDRVLLLDPSGTGEPIVIPAPMGGGTGSWQRLAP